MEDWGENGKGKQKQDERSHKRKRDHENHDIDADISNTISLSLPADIPVSLQATKEMTSARRYKLGATPKWPAQAAPSQPRPSCGGTVVPPWRDTSLW